MTIRESVYRASSRGLQDRIAPEFAKMRTKRFDFRVFPISMFAVPYFDPARTMSGATRWSGKRTPWNRHASALN